MIYILLSSCFLILENNNFLQLTGMPVTRKPVDFLKSPPQKMRVTEREDSKKKDRSKGEGLDVKGGGRIPRTGEKRKRAEREVGVLPPKKRARPNSWTRRKNKKLRERERQEQERARGGSREPQQPQEGGSREGNKKLEAPKLQRTLSSSTGIQKKTKNWMAQAKNPDKIKIDRNRVFYCHSQQKGLSKNHALNSFSETCTCPDKAKKLAIHIWGVPGKYRFRLSIILLKFLIFSYSHRSF
jgi:hypothetical protein